MTTAAIAVRNLRKDYAQTRALKDISFELPAGEIIAIVGPDGAGKTTLLRILAGILAFDAGEITLLGQSLSAQAHKHRTTIGYMPQRFGLYEDLTVQENIDFFADLFLVRGAERQTRIKRLLEFSRMDPFTERLARNLSGGMKQKLGLACALVHNPPILLLDEPTNGVDPVSRREFWRLLYDLNREGTTVVISSSYMDEAERAGRFVLLHDGTIISAGNPAEVRRDFPRAVYELASDKARELKSALTHRSEFESVVLFGRSLHLAAAPGVSADQIAAAVLAAGGATEQLRKITPSFEDIYIGLARRPHE